jgi:hypothetical protein
MMRAPSMPVSGSHAWCMTSESLAPIAQRHTDRRTSRTANTNSVHVATRSASPACAGGPSANETHPPRRRQQSLKWIDQETAAHCYFVEVTAATFLKHRYEHSSIF